MGIIVSHRIKYIIAVVALLTVYTDFISQVYAADSISAGKAKAGNEINVNPSSSETLRGTGLRDISKSSSTIDQGNKKIRKSKKKNKDKLISSNQQEKDLPFPTETNTTATGIRDMENRIKNPKNDKVIPDLPPPKRKEIPNIPLDSQKILNDNELSSPPISIKHLEITGDPLDISFFNTLKPTTVKYGSLHSEIKSKLIGSELSRKKIKEICQHYTRELVVKGTLLFTSLEPKFDLIDTNTLEINIKFGKFGRTAFLERDRDDPKKIIPFSGRYYSKKQIRDRLNFKEGDPFKYAILRGDVFAINSNPDLTLDAKLRIRTDAVTNDRSVNIDFYVNEEFPIHAVLQLDNTGTDQTDEWRSRLTLQHQNVFKRYDILSLDTSIAIDGSIYTAAASYHFKIPFTLPFVHHNSVTFFGGNSELEVDDIDKGLDTEDHGWFAGFQLKLAIIDSDIQSLDILLGITHRNTENDLITNSLTISRSLASTPIDIGVKYSNHKDDMFGGRNRLAFNFILHRDGLLGSDDDEDFNKFRQGSSSDYSIIRFRLHRFQKLLPSLGSSLLFFKIDGQLTTKDESLISTEKKAIGGFNTVRGYNEREFLGDKGISATIELRTPLFNRPIYSRYFRKLSERQQFIMFMDYGDIQNNDSLPGEENSVDLLSIGSGFLWRVGDVFQLRFDYGVALTDIPDGDDNGRFHLITQFHF